MEDASSSLRHDLVPRASRLRGWKSGCCGWKSECCSAAFNYVCAARWLTYWSLRWCSPFIPRSTCKLYLKLWSLQVNFRKYETVVNWSSTLFLFLPIILANEWRSSIGAILAFATGIIVEFGSRTGLPHRAGGNCVVIEYSFLTGLLRKAFGSRFAIEFSSHTGILRKAFGNYIVIEFSFLTGTRPEMDGF